MEILQWDSSQPYWILHLGYQDRWIVRHQGVNVEIPLHELEKEREIYRYYPKFYNASEKEKEEMLASALWSRLQRHCRVDESFRAEAP